MTMKRMMIWMSAIMLGMCLFTACDKKDKNSASEEKSTESNVLKYLPGTWEVTYYLDEGTKEPLRDKMVLTFGKENPNEPSTGAFSMTVNGSTALSGGKWLIEADANNRGVFINFENASGQPYKVDGVTSRLFITQISATYMEAMEGVNDDEGYALTKVE